tara:strand:+ start:169 stop:501 length:333 start_codon:yes stop_codon:yes gene_type:complete
MSTKKKKKKSTVRMNDENRVFTDRYGHPYHTLCHGDPDRPEEEALEILFSRIDPPIDGEDTHEILIRFPHGPQSVIMPRRFLTMILNDGWNGELSGRTIVCDGDHELIEP